jgi:hypothetical protein
MTDSNTGTVRVDGVVLGKLVGRFDDYDALVERVRERAADIGLSYQMIDEISGLAEGHCGKVLADLRARQMGLNTFLAITQSLGIRAVFFADEKLTAQMAPLYEKRNQNKAHARRRASLGPVTLKRVLPAVASEMGKRGAVARMNRTTPEMRTQLARAAARARWGYIRIDRKTGLPSIQT